MSAIMLANRPEYFEIAWGAQRAGTYWTPVNWHLTADEVAYIVADWGATVLFASPETAEVAARLPGVRVFVTGGGRPDLPGVMSYETAIAGLSASRRPRVRRRGRGRGEHGLLLLGHDRAAEGDHAGGRVSAVRRGVALDVLMRRCSGSGRIRSTCARAPLYHAAPIGCSMGTQRAAGRSC